jgi:peroxiredoxin
LELACLLGLLGVALAAGAYWGSAREAGRRESPRGFDLLRARTPEPAPDFDLQDLAGARVSLAGLRGRAVFLNFWATWCAPCREEMPAMERLHRELGERGLAVMAVNVRESADAVRAFVEELGLTFPVLLDPSGETVRRYHVQGLPTTALVDRQGILVGVALGIRAWDSRAARGALRELLDRPLSSAR